MAIQANLKRDTQTNILNLTLYPIVDGQLLFATDTGAIYEDVGINRIPCGGSVNIIDNLTSTSPVDVLSANQGRILNNSKLSKDNIIAGNNIITTVTGNNVSVEANLQIIDNLTSTDTTKTLSASQGKVLNEKKVDKTITINTKPLSANIVLNASDVQALPNTTLVPTRTSQLVNDSNFVNQTGLDGKLSPSNIIAGTNITTSISGNNITISASGGGGSATVIDNLTSTSTTDALSANQGRILNEKIGAQTDKLIYGVRWIETAGTTVGEQSTPAGERFIQYPDGTIKYGVDTNLVAEMATLNADGTITRPRNDFDNIRPWSTRKRVTDSKGNVMVQTEPFFYKKGYEIINGTSYWVEAISMAQYSGFVLPQGFIEAQGNFVTNNYTSAYEASNNGTEIAQSKSGFAPWVSITRNIATTNIQKISPYYHGLDLQSYDIFLMLFDIETATRDSQSVFSGLSNARTAVNTGQTDGLGEVPSGGYINNTDGQHSFRYRFQENPYGNVWKFIMGVNIRDYKTYVCEDYTKYADIYTPPYFPVGYTNAKGLGQYATQMGYDSSYPYANLTTTVGGSDSTYYCDLYSSDIGDRLALVGGRWGGHGSSGAHDWSCDDVLSVMHLGRGFAFSSNTLSY